MIEPNLYRLYSIMTGSKIIAGSRSEKMARYQCFTAYLWSTLPSMPYPCISVEEVVPLLRAMTDKLVLTFFCGQN